MKRLLQYIIFTIILAVAATACIDDSFTSSPADQPRFSVDTLKMGVVFTEQMTTTHRFTVRNPYSKSLSISHISVSGDDARYFRLNVDGFSGSEFSNVEIRGKDSIYVFVEATLPPNSDEIPIEINALVDFTTNGVVQSVVLSAYGQDVERLYGTVIESDTRLGGMKPYQIFDSLVVGKDATLTIEAGTRLLFHDGAKLIVDGCLKSEGEGDNPITMAGDRTGNVVSDISFDLMSRQWGGIYFSPSSHDNEINHTEIKNTVYGVFIEASEEPGHKPTLSMLNSRLHNSGDRVLTAVHADIDAIGCEFAEGGGGLVLLHGGKHRFSHCTFANYYLFSAITEPAIRFSHIDGETDDLSDYPYIEATIDNSIIYGLGKDLSHGDLTGTEVYLRNCLLKSNGSDDDNFVECVWGEDPLYYTVRNDYLFDYRLRDDSPAIGVGNPAFTPQSGATDAYGNHRGAMPDLGAYVYEAESGS